MKQRLEKSATKHKLFGWEQNEKEKNTFQLSPADLKTRTPEIFFIKIDPENKTVTHRHGVLSFDNFLYGKPTTTLFYDGATLRKCIEAIWQTESRTNHQLEQQFKRAPDLIQSMLDHAALNQALKEHRLDLLQTAVATSTSALAVKEPSCSQLIMAAASKVFSNFWAQGTVEDHPGADKTYTSTHKGQHPKQH